MVAEESRAERSGSGCGERWAGWDRLYSSQSGKQQVTRRLRASARGGGPEVVDGWRLARWTTIRWPFWGLACAVLLCSGREGRPLRRC